MKNLRLKFIILIGVVLLLAQCQKPPKGLKVVKFMQSPELSDENGWPKDSVFSYLPPQLLCDTIPRYFVDNDYLNLYLWHSKYIYAEYHHIDTSAIKDTFEVVCSRNDSLKYLAFLFYKMQEPILYNYNLHKEYYRITALRAFDPPLVISLCKSSNDYTISVKELNIYPFLDYPDPRPSSRPTVHFYPPDLAEYDTLTKKVIIHNKKKYQAYLDDLKRREDSTLQVLKNRKCYYTTYKHQTIEKRYWDTLSNLIDSSRLWKTRPSLALDNYQIDGSQWIIEGHTSYGYQIKIIPSPSFSYSSHTDLYDPKRAYAKLLNYIIKLANKQSDRIY